eukprot:1309271-Prymnesium_polylepis.1
MSQDVGFVLRCARVSRNRGVRSHEVLYRCLQLKGWRDRRVSVAERSYERSRETDYKASD